MVNRKRKQVHKSKLAKLNADPDGRVEHFVGAITSSWQKAVASIIETGKLLIQAKDEIGHGRFLDEVVANLPFGERTAEMLMAVANNKVLSNPKFISDLPASWGTLYELTAIPEHRLLELIEAKKITAETNRNEAHSLVRYTFHKVPDAIEVLAHFMREYPQPTKLVSDLAERADWNLFEWRQVPELPELCKWIVKFTDASYELKEKREAEWAEEEKERKRARKNQLSLPENNAVESV